MGEAREITISATELELLKLLADGKRSKDIGYFMKASANVVDQRVMQLKNKLGAETNAGAVAIAFRKGWIA